MKQTVSTVYDSAIKLVYTFWDVRLWLGIGLGQLDLAIVDPNRATVDICNNGPVFYATQCIKVGLKR